MLAKRLSDVQSGNQASFRRDVGPAEVVKTQPLLRLSGFGVAFPTADGGQVHAVEGVSITVGKGQSYAFVGESGSGKTATCLGFARLLARGRHRLSGQAVFDGIDLIAANNGALSKIHGRRIGVVFQDAVGRLDPLKTVRSHFLTTFRHLVGLRGRKAVEKAHASLAEAGLGDPASVLEKYPHELSGGMAQRVMIALALAGDPELIIADEPTTALDLENRLRILALLKNLTKTRDAALILVTHDLQAAAYCDRIAVFYAGQLVETADISAGLGELRHPYSTALLRSVPRLRQSEPPKPIGGVMPAHGERGDLCRFAARCQHRRSDCMLEPVVLRTHGEGSLRCHVPAETLPALATELRFSHASKVKIVKKSVPAVIELREICKAYQTKPFLGLIKRGPARQILRNVSFSIGEGECLALIGESGSGKSTVCNIVLGLSAPTSGYVEFDFDGSNGPDPIKRRLPRAQMVFQEVHSAFDPRLTIGRQIAEPLRVNGIGTAADRRDAALKMLRKVRLEDDLMNARSGQLSGGQLQRAAIARALMLSPRLLVCDEPTSALDVSVQAEIIELFKELKQTLGVAILFVTHDLATVWPLADRVAVMLAGEVVETGPPDHVSEKPRHPYTRRLIELCTAFESGLPGACDSTAGTNPGDHGQMEKVV
ncbi:oligopeptide/dipeptide ABC transporter ATP-binding protein [Stappia sp.]|uniref:oligopeptide/dipeptide ABC transporter ATP-binding protein n=1 Tax=Stappia sp. TaxID=1870903 RepID=UPI003A9926C2